MNKIHHSIDVLVLVLVGLVGCGGYVDNSVDETVPDQTFVTGE